MYVRYITEATEDHQLGLLVLAALRALPFNVKVVTLNAGQIPPDWQTYWPEPVSLQCRCHGHGSHYNTTWSAGHVDIVCLRNPKKTQALVAGTPGAIAVLPGLVQQIGSQELPAWLAAEVYGQLRAQLRVETFAPGLPEPEDDAPSFLSEV